MPDPRTVFALAQRGAAQDIAFAADGREALTYGQLRRHVAAVVDQLNGFGIGRGDRVAIVLPNGPEMASAFVAIAAGATTAPLNPAYKLPEFEFYLRDLGATALVVAAGDDSPATTTAGKLDLPVIQLTVQNGAPAGIFDLFPPQRLPVRRALVQPGYAQADDTALLLHTSGTTSRPKMVPLSQRNICASADNVRETLALTSEDRCLSIMPLFHIHGLVAGLLASLAAGGSVVCPPGFNAFKFLAWLHEMHPTWYSAVPSMHQAILQRASGHRDITGAGKLRTLRLIRSSSAALAPRVMTEVEALFGVPVIESYGMTEAAHQITSNPLPPRPRKAGTVGVAAGPEVAVMDQTGRLLLPGEVGEVVIRGPNVMHGYANDSGASTESFTHGWFRTGDQGALDAEGYLTITGRLKEIINRGGEKISPREVDDVLLDHPAVAHAVTFALPHEKLGEEVGAAVVLRQGATAEVRELRDFAAERLADFKVPHTLLIVDEIPTGPTGKMQRVGLAERLGLTGT